MARAAPVPSCLTAPHSALTHGQGLRRSAGRPPALPRTRRRLPPPSPQEIPHLPIPRDLGGGHAGSIRMRGRRRHGARPRAEVVTPAPGAPPVLPGRVRTSSAPRILLLSPRHRRRRPVPGTHLLTGANALACLQSCPPSWLPSRLRPARPSLSHRRLLRPPAAPPPRRSPRSAEPRGLPATHPAAKQSGLPPHPGFLV